MKGKKEEINKMEI